MDIQENIPLLEEILGSWSTAIGEDYQAYRNHIYRVINFCLALYEYPQDDIQKLAIAGAFHDIGIWSDSTVDYIDPSVDLAQQYLRTHHLELWLDEISLIIQEHHKITQYQGNDFPLVEYFRQADAVDVTLGIRKFGLSRDYIKQVNQVFPNLGFHKNLVQLSMGEIMNGRPPLPMLKW